MQANVLIVDDDANARWILSTHVRNMGCAVIEVQNAAEALALLGQGHEHIAAPVDLVITDVWMPGMSGVELLKRIRESHPDLPVAMISARATLSSSLEAINAGAYAYLTKPFRTDEIQQVVARGLQKVEEGRIRQALYEYAGKLSALEHRVSELQERTSVVPHSMVSELFAGLRHELGNMATAIKLNLEVINERQAIPDDLRENLDDLQATVDDLVSLLARFKEYPEPSRSSELIDLRDVISAALDAAHNRDVSGRMQVVVTLPDDALCVYGMPAELSRAVLHLLENAMDAAHQTGGQVYLTAMPQGNTAVITINDDGPGFATAILDEPFLPSYTTKTQGGFLHGLGLGLFITRMVISLHGGQIGLSNRSEGGASVRVQLPLALPNPTFPS